MKSIRNGSPATRGLVAVAVAALATCAVANVTNTIPYSASFETNAVDSGLIGGGGWYGLVSTGLIVRALPITYPLVLPLPGETHSNIVELVEPSTNLFSHPGGDTNVWIDVMVKPVRSAVLPEVEKDVQVALCFNADGNLMVRHSYYTDDYTLKTNWTALSHPTLPSGKWARVTLKLDYYTGDLFGDGSMVDKFFQIHINGGEALTSQYAVTQIPWDTVNPPPSGGSYFMLANSGFGAGPSNISSLAFQGTGFIDDLSLLKSDPLAMTGTTYTISATATPGGTIYPGGTFEVPAGKTVPFEVYAEPGRWIQNILVDGSSVGPTNSGDTVFGYTFDAVTANHTIAAQFNAYTSKGVDASWLQSFGLTDYENDQWLDSDGDGATNWQEYVAGTVPTNPSSVFHVMEVSYMGSSNRVVWYGTLDGDTTTPFSMLRNTNLLSATWSLIASNSIPRDVTGTNTWWDTNVPDGVPSFYRPTILWPY